MPSDNQRENQPDNPPVALPPEVIRLRRWARAVLVPVGLIGAALSFASIYHAALASFGPWLAAGFPALVDFLILGASLQYIAGAKVGRPRAGWRLTAHAGVVSTLALNALAAEDVAHLPWHVVAPAVWSVLVEMTAREVLGEWKAVHAAPADRIPARLWLTAPVESARTWLLMARTGATSHGVARVDVGVRAAAGEALRLALPGLGPRRVRKIIRRQLRAGSLAPSDVLASLGWTDASATLVTDPAAVLRATLEGVLSPPRPSSVPAASAGAVEAAQRRSPGRESSAPSPSAVTTSPLEPARPDQPTLRAAGPDRGVASPAADAGRADAAHGGAARSDAARGGTVRSAAAPSGGARAGGARTGAGRTGADRAREASAGGAGAGEDLFTALDAPRRPVNDPIFVTPAGDRPAPAATLESTGDRPSDAVAWLRMQPGLTAPELGERLRGMGWVLSDRTAHRVLAEAAHHLRSGRLTAVP